MSKPAWSARCNCYNGHPSASGRCTCRYDGIPPGEHHLHNGVVDPTRDGDKFEQAVCSDCRKNCPAGNGTRKEEDE